MFSLKRYNHVIVLLLYVDGIILARTLLSEFDLIKFIVDNIFKINDLGILEYFLGLEVSHSKESIVISQKVLFGSFE